MFPMFMFGILGVGTLAVTVAALVLGLRGALPGTRKAKDQPRGFAVEAAQQ
jgi:hypothetical protein